MQRQVEPHKVDSSNNFETKNFTFNASADAFKIIYDNLYSRPDEAVVRELSCNAFDSHVKAGKRDVPIEVKIPTKLNNEFYVKDYGTGLTPAEIKEVYTVVFKSDKTHTNDMTGCFGLGSKSPFAIVSQFSIESVVNGIKWIYSAFLDENRIPTIADMSNGGIQTDESNGVKVSFPVPRDRHYCFIDSAKNIFKYFEVTPIVHGMSAEDIKPAEYEHFEKNFYGLKSKSNPYPYYSSGSASCSAIMGNVRYKIEVSQFDEQLTDGLDLYFNLGELSPTPSREYLQYDDKTKKAIQRKHKEFLKSFTKKVVKDVENASSLWEARKLHYQTVQKYMHVLKINNSQEQFVWKGATYKTNNLFIPHNVRVYRNGETYSNKEVEYNIQNILYFLLCRSDCNRKVLFVIPDEKKSFVSKTKHASKRSGLDQYILLSNIDNCLQVQIEFLKNEVGIPNDMFLYSSDLEKPPRKERNKNNSIFANGSIKVLTTYINRSKMQCWRDLKTNEEIPEVGYYVFTTRGNWGEKPDIVRHDHTLLLHDIYRVFEFLGIKEPKIYGILPSAKKQIPKDWKPVRELKHFFEWLISDNEIKHIIAIRNDVFVYNSRYDYFNEIFTSSTKLDSIQKIKDKKLRQFVALTIKGSKFGCRKNRFGNSFNSKNVDKIEKVLKFLGLEKKHIQPVVEKLKKEQNLLLKKYPLIKCIEGHYVKCEDELIEYFNLVHKSELKKQKKQHNKQS